jgi:glycosyltransferase involved in cell wall biosynthesis
MRVLVVSGIWPPDVGGPASHAPELAAFLHGRGHEVTVLVTAATAPAAEAYPVEWVSRSLPKGAVHLRAAAEAARLARRADVVYTTGMFSRSAVGAAVARTPYVLKLTGDPAFERLRWRGRVTGDVEMFQHGGGGAEAAVLRRVRDATVRGATHVVCPSAFIRDLVVQWGVRPAEVTVVPNAVPLGAPAGDEWPHAGLLLAFAGRIGPQKSLDVLLDAIEGLDGVSLVVAGDGELHAELERSAPPNAQFVGALSRARTLGLFAAADAMVLPSSWENFPHTVVESLGVGTPVVATAVGGVPEVVEDGVNGLLVPAGDREALRAAIVRLRDDDELRTRLARAARPSVERFEPATVYAELESILAAAARR